MPDFNPTPMTGLSGPVTETPEHPSELDLPGMSRRADLLAAEVVIRDTLADVAEDAATLLTEVTREREVGIALLDDNVKVAKDRLRDAKKALAEQERLVRSLTPRASRAARAAGPSSATQDGAE
jgi:hypothetical protein